MSDLPPGFEIVSCPGCGSDRHTTALDVQCTIVRCDDCGLHYTNPRPWESELGNYYPADYMPYRGGDEKDGDAGSRRSLAGLVMRDAFGAPAVRPSLAGRAAARVLTMFRRAENFGFGVPYRGRGRLLDFGCGGGKFLRRMHALGWDVT